MSYLNIRAPFRRLKIESAEHLWDSFMAYAEHSDSTPIVEPKIFNAKEELRYGDLDKIRPYTLHGLCNFIGISPGTWSLWLKKERDEIAANSEHDTFFFEVMSQIESIIYDQQYQGAAVDIFNASVVSRKLGLAEKKDVSVIESAFVQDIDSEMTPREAAELYEQTLHPDKG